MKWWFAVRKRIDLQIVSLLISLVALVFLLWLLSPASVTVRNLFMTSRQAALLIGILAIGQSLVMLTPGGIDLSLGETMTLSMTLSVGLMQGQNDMVLPGALICLAVAAFVGLLNGLIIVKINVPPLITTLAMGLIIRGIYLLYTGGAPKGGVPRQLAYYANGRIGVVPVVVLIWIGLTIVGIFVLRKTSFGRKLYLTGVNPVAARLCGINTNMVMMMAYTIAGLLAGAGGLLYAGYLGISTLQFDRQAFMLNPIAASIIGGTTFAGGEGGVAGTFLGALILQVLGNVLIIMRISEPGRLIIQGLIIGGMVALNGWQQRS